MVEVCLRALARFFVLIGVLVIAQGAPAAADSPVGRWVSIDDKDGRPRSVIEIADVAGALQAKVVQIYDRPGDNPGHLCKKCNGDLKDKPVIGIREASK